MIRLGPLDTIRASFGYTFLELIEDFQSGAILDDVAILRLYMMILNRVPSQKEVDFYKTRIKETKNFVVTATELVMNSRKEIYNKLRTRGL